MMQLQTGYGVCAVPTEMIDEAWPAVYPLLEEAVQQSFGVISSDDVYKDLISGHASLWIAEKDKVIKAACVVTLVNYPQGVAMRIWLLAGEGFAQWKDGIAHLESFARKHKCRFIEAIARPGLGKLAKDLGFEHRRVLLIKKLDLETH